MSDNYINDDLESDDSGSNDLRALRKAAADAKRLKAENAELVRQITFAKAGISVDDPKMKYFVKGYDGDMEVEAIRAAANEAGFLAPVQAVSSEQKVQQQMSLEAQDRVISASAGAIAEDASEAAALARMEAAMNEGGVDAMLDVVRQYGIPIASEQ
jgi:hypothetical protein